MNESKLTVYYQTVCAAINTGTRYHRELPPLLRNQKIQNTAHYIQKQLAE
jgi:hypothetical protein